MNLFCTNCELSQKPLDFFGRKGYIIKRRRKILHVETEVSDNMFRYNRIGPDVDDLIFGENTGEHISNR